MSTGAPAEHAIDLPAGTEETWAAVALTAAEWGAELERTGDEARLGLPVVHGLRRGFVAGRLTAEPSAAGCRLAFLIETSELRAQRAAVVVLAISAAAGVVVFLWPFFPRLLALVPLALVLSVSGWLLVMTRLRTSGPQEFLEAVAAARAGAS